MNYDEATYLYIKKFNSAPPVSPALIGDDDFVRLMLIHIDSGIPLTEEIIDSELGEQPWNW